MCLISFNNTFIPLLDPVPEVTTPCVPNPCGPNSICRPVNGQSVCSCMPDYIGTPPGCRPECTISSECAANKACLNHKCIDPCPGHCGTNANCRVINHSPMCSCSSGFTGDPFTRCYASMYQFIYIKNTNNIYCNLFRVYNVYFLLQFPYKIYQNRTKIHAYQVHVAITRYAVILMALLRVLVCRIILASLQIASLSAPLTKIVHRIKPA